MLWVCEVVNDNNASELLFFVLVLLELIFEALGS